MTIGIKIRELGVCNDGNSKRGFGCGGERGGEGGGPRAKETREIEGEKFSEEEGVGHEGGKLRRGAL